ncbi:phosphotyrosine protein phosphatase I superfamily [Boletus edulis]|nr:phosphotyrosine protein phosphatase I superfamily [Boletus edulis]
MTLSVLIVCLGNICRSPMGEAVLRHEATKRGIDIHVDSAGTGAYHIGEDPDYRLQTKDSCRTQTRQAEEADFNKFQYILAADGSNLRNLMAKKPGEGTATVRLWGSYLDNKPISDPYYGDIVRFSPHLRECFEECTRFSKAFLDEVVSKNLITLFEVSISISM